MRNTWAMIRRIYYLQIGDFFVFITVVIYHFTFRDGVFPMWGILRLWLTRTVEFSLNSKDAQELHNLS